ncbi:type II toxin-antitoxin system HipA family toxin [Acetatifactor muris]|uniref:Putative DNA-binding transcriptional regulator n=1 Tax=Acetatifactor muris TaxID=879566 RepID=A0A2K4ZL08_9FIRM|nr:type II toxin-antitoxin system HipA family toxin [Acetatifactor muris]MCR2050071.1 type II toxin-antitoxin system HipA family toxin [Acetatifactor muris]SOY31174.1 putative DNA-binding transcriptional regulator [Acetatifactor muris]
MSSLKKMDVFYQGRKVGTLAETRDRLVAFEYDSIWLSEGFPISPFSLPLEKKVFLPKPEPFEGLYGAFADSLPDGWGRLLVDRMLLREHINPHQLNSLDRLAIVGESGMGALTYRPCHAWTSPLQTEDYDRIAVQCRQMLLTDTAEDFDQLFRMGGSSGGARPKILTQVSGEAWLIKFPSAIDKPDIGTQEYAYAKCAADCGIQMSETRLFPSAFCGGYFGTKRFDRYRDRDGKEQRVHMLTVSAILETSHRIPNLDYHTLMKLTSILTRDYSQLIQLFRRMCFNVFAHNRDDHSRNFTYLYDEEQNRWYLSPAYDLTYSNSIGGEHATCVNGNGYNPGRADLLAVAAQAGIEPKEAGYILQEVEEKVSASLSHISIH